MIALEMTALHLRIAEFKFTHNFVICNRLLDTEIFVWYGYTEEVFSFICLGQGEKLLYTKGWNISHLHIKLRMTGDNWHGQINTQDTTITQWCCTN